MSLNNFKNNDYTLEDTNNLRNVNVILQIIKIIIIFSEQISEYDNIRKG